MTAGEVHLAELAGALAAHGLILRGGFHPDGEQEFEGAATILLVGNAGPAMWDAFAPHIDGDADPLNRWTESIIEPIAATIPRPRRVPLRRAPPAVPAMGGAGGDALSFADRPPDPPGIRPVARLARGASISPSSCRFRPGCKPRALAIACDAKPCLSACPVGAFSYSGYDVSACASHIATRDADCNDSGCRARNACPVGGEWRYPEAQIRFHMAAFARSVSRANATGAQD